MKFAAGDTIEVLTQRVGEAPRTGDVVEVLHEDPPELRVMWHADGHESTIRPAGGMVRKRERTPDSS